jgi:hypothetical protein
MLEERGLDVPDDVRHHIEARVARNKLHDINEYICRVPFIRTARDLLLPRW